jgi:hypothetical protein
MSEDTDPEVAEMLSWIDVQMRRGDAALVRANNASDTFDALIIQNNLNKFERIRRILARLNPTGEQFFEAFRENLAPDLVEWGRQDDATKARYEAAAARLNPPAASGDEDPSNERPTPP